MKKWEQMSELKKSLAAIGIAILVGALFILLSGESPHRGVRRTLKGSARKSEIHSKHNQQEYPSGIYRTGGSPWLPLRHAQYRS